MSNTSFDPPVFGSRSPSGIAISEEALRPIREIFTAAAVSVSSDLGKHVADRLVFIENKIVAAMQFYARRRHSEPDYKAWGESYRALASACIGLRSAINALPDTANREAFRYISVDDAGNIKRKLQLSSAAWDFIFADDSPAVSMQETSDLLSILLKKAIEAEGRINSGKGRHVKIAERGLMTDLVRTWGDYFTVSYGKSNDTSLRKPTLRAFVHACNSALPKKIRLAETSVDNYASSAAKALLSMEKSNP